MKKLFNVSAIALIVLSVVAASCGSSRNTTSRYPYPGSTYPYPESRYPQGYPYPRTYPADRYPDYGRYPSRRPVVVKKVYKQRPAKVYAPGQRKKYDRHDNHDRDRDRKNDNWKRDNRNDDRRNNRR